MAFSEPMIGGTQACNPAPVAKTGRPSWLFFHRLRYGLAFHWALYTVIVGTIVTAALTSYMYQGSVNALIDGELNELAATNQVAGQRFAAGIAFAREDATILARAPLLAGLMRARANGGIDPVDGFSEQQALLQAETTFRAILEERPDYIQLRFIAADGREVIRMERLTGGLIELAPPQTLRDVTDRPYFKAAASLPQGRTYISDFDLLQPSGSIEEPYRPVVRAAAPAYDANGQLLGIAVVNVDLNKLFYVVTQTVHQQAFYYIANANGDYLYHPDPRKTFGFLLGQRYLIQDDLPQFAPLFAEERSNFAGIVSMNGQQYVADARRIDYGLRQPERDLVLATLRPKAYVAEAITALRNRTLLMAGAIMIVGTLAVVGLAHRLVRPLHALTDASAGIAAGEHEIFVDAAARRTDEVGDLARSFKTMAAEIKVRDDQVRARTDELTRSNNELAQFAYVASHDLQEPLRMVDSYLGLIERRYSDKLDDDAHEFIGYAVDGARRMKSLINDLLAYSRVSNRPLNFDVVDTGNVVASVLKMLAHPIAESGAQIAVAALPQVAADYPQMERLFVNLIENAIKYRGADPPLIRVAAAPKDDAWEFSVADNGIGIAPEFRERVFEIFARLHGRENYPGSGIGLASCHRIVERHGGSIWVDATPGGGTTIRFTLPLREPRRETGHA